MTKDSLSWSQIGKLPANQELESKLDLVRYENTNFTANHDKWLQNLEENIKLVSSGEREFFAELQGQLDSQA